MTIKNRYYTRSKISTAKFRKLIHYFSFDLTATETAHLSGISLRSVNAIYLKIRHRIAEECQRQSPFTGTVEADGATEAGVAGGIAADPVEFIRQQGGARALIDEAAAVGEAQPLLQRTGREPL